MDSWVNEEEMMIVDQEVPHSYIQLQSGVTLEMIMDNVIDCSLINLSKCVMVFKALDLIFPITSMNNSIVMESKSYTEWKKVHKKEVRMLYFIERLSGASSFDLRYMFQNFGDSHVRFDYDLSGLYNFIHGGLCGYNDDSFNFLLDYIAHIFQYPFVKPNIVVLMLGNQGTGKGLLFTLLESCLKNFTQKLTGFDEFAKFSLKITSAIKFLVLMDECCLLKLKELQILKDLTTSKQRELNLKPKCSPLPIPIYYRIFIYSNNTEIIQMGPTERRYFVLNPTLKPKIYYQQLCDFLFDSKTKDIKKIVVQKFMDDMLQRDISNFDIHSPLITDLQKDIIKNDLPSYKKHIISFILASGNWLREWRSNQEVFNYFASFTQSNNVKIDLDHSNLGQAFLEFCDTREKKVGGKIKKEYRLQEGVNLSLLE